MKFNSASHRGVPDRIVFLPDGVLRLVELKRPGQAARLEQRHLHDKLRALGFKVFVLDTVHAAETWLP